MDNIDTPIYLTILYYIRTKFYGSATIYCEKALKKRPNDQQLLLFQAICMIFEGKYTIAIRLLEELKNDNDLRLAVLMAMKHAHSSTKVPDVEAKRNIENEIEILLKTANETGMFNAAVICNVFGWNTEAYELIESAVLLTPDSAQTNCLRGWIWLMQDKDPKSALVFFEKSIKQAYPDAFLGKAKLLERRHNVTEACQVLSLLLAQIPTFLPALIEYTKMLFMCRVWSKIEEQVQRILMFEPSCVPAHLVQAVYAVAVEGKSDNIKNSLGELTKAMALLESHNDYIYFTTAQLFTRLLKNTAETFKIAETLLEKAIAIDEKPEYLGEKVKLLVVTENTKEAHQLAMETLKNEPSPLVLLGLVNCFLVEGRLKDAVSQMQFIQASYPKVVDNKFYLYVSALLCRAQNASLAEFMQAVRRMVDPHIGKLQNFPFGIDYIREMDVNLLLKIVEELLNIAPVTPTEGGEQTLREITRILTFINNNCPGLAHVEYLLAKVRYLCMETEATELLLSSCLDKDSSIPEAHLLLAQIKIKKADYPEAEKCLARGLSFNFNLQYHPVYQLIKAKIQKHQQNYEASVETLQNATKLDIFSTADKQKQKQLNITESDQITIYLELIDSLHKIGRLKEANEYLAEAEKRWSNKPEEQQLMLLDANLRLEHKDIDGALSVLAKITPNQSTYKSARIQMANIYLHYKKNKEKFVECYRRLIENDKSPSVYVLLGDAYMSIQEPVRAIEIYEEALGIDPKDDALAEKIGEAYIHYHLYSKAVSYYENALENGRRDSMRIRLAKLLIDLKEYQKCEKILRQALDDGVELYEDSKIRTAVTFRTLLATVYAELNKFGEGIQELQKAYELQKDLLNKSGNMVNAAEQKSITAEILSQLADLYLRRREVNKAIETYQESITFSDQNLKAMLSLATLYSVFGKTDECRRQCEQILDIDPSNTDAILMLADLSYEKNEGDLASERFAQILEQNPNQYQVLSRYIELRWRSSDIKNAEKFIKAAVEANQRATTHAGFNYCKGLYQSYLSDLSGALQSFNRARRDLVWGERATYRMIEICLNPDSEFINGDNVENSDGPELTNINTQEVRREMAERFLKDLQIRPKLGPNYNLVEQFIMLQHSDRNIVQQALKNFLEMCGSDTEEVQNVAALYGSAKAYLILKQTHKAKAQLKRVLNRNWTIAEADGLERCWILLADIYIAQNKTDQATNVLRTLLRYNESSVKGFECMGQVHEIQQHWSDAAANYDKAWKLTGRKHPAIGFKLAQCYLKAKKLFDCIDVCHEVLAICPKYPLLKKEVMDKARSHIRI